MNYYQIREQDLNILGIQLQAIDASYIRRDVQKSGI
jgi:hypothetical protein